MALFLSGQFYALNASARTACMPSQNVTHFFAGAERQFETKSQALEIKHALNDMLTLDIPSLKRVRYADYQGKAGQWQLFYLLQRYYVPAHHENISERCFWRDLANGNGKLAIQQQLMMFSHINLDALPD